MHEVSNPAGRLILFRIVPPVSDDNSGPAASDLRARIVGVPGQVIVLSDITLARAFSQETIDRFITLMRSDNPKLLRGAFLYSAESATLGLQVSRMLKEAGNPNRRAFTQTTEMLAWLEPVLTPEENEALRARYAS